MEINVQKMSCKHCEKRVIDALKKLKLKKIKVDLETGNVTFSNKKNIEFKLIKNEIESLGFVVLQKS